MRDVDGERVHGAAVADVDRERRGQAGALRAAGKRRNGIERLIAVLAVLQLAGENDAEPSAAVAAATAAAATAARTAAAPAHRHGGRKVLCEPQAQVVRRVEGDTLGRQVVLIARLVGRAWNELKELL